MKENNETLVDLCQQTFLQAVNCVEDFFAYCVNMYTFVMFIQICGYNKARQRDKLARLLDDFGSLKDEVSKNVFVSILHNSIIQNCNVGRASRRMFAFDFRQIPMMNLYNKKRSVHHTRQITDYISDDNRSKRCTDYFRCSRRYNTHYRNVFL